MSAWYDLLHTWSLYRYLAACTARVLETCLLHGVISNGQQIGESNWVKLLPPQAAHTKINCFQEAIETIGSRFLIPLPLKLFLSHVLLPFLEYIRGPLRLDLPSPNWVTKLKALGRELCRVSDRRCLQGGSALKLHQPLVLQPSFAPFPSTSCYACRPTLLTWLGAVSPFAFLARLAAVAGLLEIDLSAMRCR